MANEQDSKSSNAPSIGLLAGALLVFIVVVFFVGWFVMKHHQPKVKQNILPRTGMSILYTSS